MSALAQGHPRFRLATSFRDLGHRGWRRGRTHRYRPHDHERVFSCVACLGERATPRARRDRHVTTLVVETSPLPIPGEAPSTTSSALPAARSSAGEQPPAACPICDDDRQYLGRNGQQWTTLAELRADHANELRPIDPGITGIVTVPQVAIGQQAHLIQTPHGNVLCDCISYLDDATIAAVRELGGIAAITISHPHFFSAMIEWAAAFDAPIYLHAEHRPWVIRPEPAVTYWEGETREILPGVTSIRCAGHFPGSTVAHGETAPRARARSSPTDTIRSWPIGAGSALCTVIRISIPMDADSVRRDRRRRRGRSHMTDSTAW